MSEVHRQFCDGREPIVNNKERLAVSTNTCQWYPRLKNAMNNKYRLLLNSKMSSATQRFLLGTSGSSCSCEGPTVSIRRQQDSALFKAHRQ